MRVYGRIKSKQVNVMHNLFVPKTKTNHPNILSLSLSLSPSILKTKLKHINHRFVVLLCGIIGIIFSIAAAQSCDFITCKFLSSILYSTFYMCRVVSFHDMKK